MFAGWELLYRETSFSYGCAFSFGSRYGALAQHAICFFADNGSATVFVNGQLRLDSGTVSVSVRLRGKVDELPIAERVDHRSYTRQGVEKVLTVHLGVAASQMEKRGIPTVSDLFPCIPFFTFGTLPSFS